MAYVCTNCNFRPKAVISDECPYCGKNTVEKERSSQQLIDEIDSILNN